VLPASWPNGPAQNPIFRSCAELHLSPLVSEPVHLVQLTGLSAARHVPCRLPGGHGGFLGGEYGQMGEPDAFAATLRTVLAGEARASPTCRGSAG
jgi:hypothetical protein